MQEGLQTTGSIGVLVAAGRGRAVREGAQEVYVGLVVRLVVGDVDDGLVEVLVAAVPDDALKVLLVAVVLAAALVVLVAHADHGLGLVLVRRVVVEVVLVVVRVHVRAGEVRPAQEADRRSARHERHDAAARGARLVRLLGPAGVKRPSCAVGRRHAATCGGPATAI